MAAEEVANELGVAVNENLIPSTHWENTWERATAPRPLRAWRSYSSWRFAEVFKRHISAADRVLEVGCGGSRWLPFFAREIGAEVWGLDYSSAGVRSAIAGLSAVGAKGKVVLGDLFSTIDLPRAHFHCVWSGGFIEHFSDTAGTITRMAEFLAPQGTMITEVPNMHGIIGGLHRIADPELFSQHIRLSPAEMDEAHRRAGLETVVPAAYFGTFLLSVVGFGRPFGNHKRALALFQRSLDLAQTAVTAPLWIVRARPESKTFSPYVLGVYRRPS